MAPLTPAARAKLLEDGVLALQEGRAQDAYACYQQLTGADGQDAEALNGLVVALLSLNRSAEALAAARKLTSLAPQVPLFQGTLGQALAASGEFAAAVQPLTLAVNAEPALFPLLGVLAHCLDQAGRPADAVQALDRLIALDPDDMAARNDRAVLLEGLGRASLAEVAYRDILARPGQHPEAAYNLGNLLTRLNRPRDALALFDSALAIRPQWASAWHNRGIAQSAVGALTGAADSYRQAIACDSQFVEPLTGLAAVLRDLGDTPAAMDLCARAEQLAPERPDVAGRGLFTANYHPDWDGERLADEYRRFNARFVQPLAQQSAPPVPSPFGGRRLRLAYFSPDFRQTSMAAYIRPLLDHHDRARFELFAYHLSSAEDAVTQELAAGFDHFSQVAHLDDAALAARIRQDGIDILIDLAGHANGGRPLALARRPAPVMLSLHGLGATTGISVLDGYITDAIMSPDGAETAFVEPVRRLGLTAACWRPPVKLPVDLNSAPSAPGPVFCSMSRTARLNRRVLSLWGQILRALPEARLRLDQLPFTDPPTAQAFRDLAVSCGVPADRLDLTYQSPAWLGYGQSDIALDPFPHNGGVTTLEALWMGLPVITLAARPPLGRISASFLTAIGRQDLIAASEEQYLETAIRLGQDVQAVRAGRAALHEAMAKSPLRDEAGFTASLERLCLDILAAKFP